MELTFKTLLVAGALGGLLGAEAQASTYLYTLNQSNVAELPDGTPYLTVQIEDAIYGVDTNAIKFTVDIIDTVFTAGSNFGIQDFGFNQAAGAPAIADSNIVAPTGWAGNIAPPNNQLDGFGRFLGDTSTAGSSRLATLVFWITGVNGDNPLSYIAPSTGNANQGNAWFAAHVTGFTVTGSSVTSAYFGGGDSTTAPQGGDISAVPLPAAFWLFASAITGLVASGRRDNRPALR